MKNKFEPAMYLFKQDMMHFWWANHCNHVENTLFTAYIILHERFGLKVMRSLEIFKIASITFDKS